jgi:hypothetical protein
MTIRPGYRFEATPRAYVRARARVAPESLAENGASCRAGAQAIEEARTNFPPAVVKKSCVYVRFLAKGGVPT